MSKRDSDKPKGPPPTPDPTLQITDSQILGKPEAAPPPMPKGKRRSTTHGVGWYASDDSGELRRPTSNRTWKIIALIAALVAGAAVAAAIYTWKTKQDAGAVKEQKEPKVVAKVVPSIPDAGLPPDAAPAKAAPPDAGHADAGPPDAGVKPAVQPAVQPVVKKVVKKASTKKKKPAPKKKPAAKKKPTVR